MSKKRKKRLFVDTSMIHKKKGSKADQALRLAKSNKKNIRQVTEYASNNVNVTAQALGVVPIVEYLEPLGQGLATQIVSVHIKGVIEQNLASTLTDSYRLDLVLDRNPNASGVSLTPLQYLEVAQPTIYAHRIFEERQRFKIIKTWSGYFNESTNVARKIDGFFSINLRAKTNDTGDFGVAGLMNNGLFLVYWSKATANFPTISYSARIVSKDV